MFEQQVNTLKAEGKIIKIGTIVDSTIKDMHQQVQRAKKKSVTKKQGGLKKR